MQSVNLRSFLFLSRDALDPFLLGLIKILKFWIKIQILTQRRLKYGDTTVTPEIRAAAHPILFYKFTAIGVCGAFSWIKTFLKIQRYIL